MVSSRPVRTSDALAISMVRFSQRAWKISKEVGVSYRTVITRSGVAMKVTGTVVGARLSDRAMMTAVM
jgi:hypothetical protein